MSGLVAFFHALPDLLRLLSRLGSFLEKQKKSAWIDELDFALSKAEKATTTEERVSAARALVGVIRKL